MSTLWAELTWPKIEQAAKEGYMVIIPCGSTEQHGYHLPLDTDSVNVFEVAKRVSERMKKILVTPPIWTGFSPGNLSFPGTISLKAHTWDLVIFDGVDCIAKHGFKKIVLLNGHGGQVANAQAVAERIMDEKGIRILLITWFFLIAEDISRICQSDFFHACEFETSVQMALRPHLAEQGEKVKIGEYHSRGLTDKEIAEKLGIDEREVTEIRIIAEVDLIPLEMWDEAEKFKRLEGLWFYRLTPMVLWATTQHKNVSKGKEQEV